MTIPLERVPAYLLRRDLVTPDDIVDRGLSVTDVSRRSRNCRVETAGGPAYLLKQAAGPEGEFAVLNEATAYRWLWREANSSVHALLPKLIDFDAGEGLLILELIPDAEDLGAYQRRRRRLPISFAQALGGALARLHALDVSCDVPAEPMRRDVAWPLTVHRPSFAEYQDAAPASLELFRIVQRYPEIGEGLDGLRGGWRADSFVHNDLKWDNCLLARAGGVRRSNLKIIDWEAAGVGDPRWDFGCVLAAFLEAWVRSMPLGGQAGTAALPELARYPLERAHPAARTLIAAYATSGGPLASERDWLTTSMGFCAARLLELAYAESQRAEQLSGGALILLQLSLNILRRPNEAPALLGLPAP